MAPASLPARWALAAAALLLAPALAAGDAPLPPGLIFGHLIVADPLFGSSGQGSLYTIQADDPTAMASTTKSYTLHLALEALAGGWVDLDDDVTLSELAAGTGGSYMKDQNDAQPEAGEVVKLRHLLRGMMYPSGNDAAMAIAEHVMTGQTLGFCKLFGGSEGCVAMFVNQMNAHLEAEGHEVTHFANPHGMDAPGHRTTPREQSRFWHHAYETDPMFGAITGYKGTYDFTTLAPSGVKFYEYPWGKTYPGWEGHKGGDTPDCSGPDEGAIDLGCMIISATRLDRRVVLSYMQGDTATIDAPLFDHGFAQLFHPTQQALSAPWKEVTDASLACVSSDRAVTGVVTPAGHLKLLLWDVDLDEHTIETLAEPVTPGLVPGQAGFQIFDPMFPPPPPPLPPVVTAARDAVGPWVSWGDKRTWQEVAALANDAQGPILDFEEAMLEALPEPPEGPTEGGLPAPVVSEVEVAYMGGDSGLLAVARRMGLGIGISTWGITPTDQLFHIDGPVLAGAGTDVRLQALPGGLLAAAWREPQTEVLRIGTWRVDLDTGALEFLAKNTFEFGVEEFDLAGRTYLVSPQLFTAARNTGDDLQVDGWSVHPFTGAIDHIDSYEHDGSTATHIAVAAVGLVAQWPETFPPSSWAVAYRSDEGTMRLHYYKLGSEVDYLDSAGPAAPVDASGDLLLAPLGRHGAVTVARVDPDHSGDFAVAEARRDNALDDVDVYRLSQHMLPSGMESLDDLCQVPYGADPPSEGDYLLAFQSTQGLGLAGWRVAPRP